MFFFPFLCSGIPDLPANSCMFSGCITNSSLTIYSWLDMTFSQFYNKCAVSTVNAGHLQVLSYITRRF